jgi:hypothetical protein
MTTAIQISARVMTDREARLAKEIGASNKARQKQIDHDLAERRGEYTQVRKLDGLGLLYKAQDLDDDQYRAGLKYQAALTTIQGGRGRNPLDMTPPGDRDCALQAIIDAGKLVDQFEAHCTTQGELAALRSIVGLGHSVRSLASGRKYRAMCELVIDLLRRMVRSGL